MGLAGAALVMTLTSCQIYNSYPVTQTDGSGSSVNIPNTSTKAVVWGTRPEAVQSLTTWLLKRGVTLVDDVKINQMASDTHLHQPLSNSDIFKLAKSAGAKQVIFIDADVSTWRVSGLESAFGQSPTVYTASVFIRALDAGTGEIYWNGKAHSTDRFTNLTEGMHQLTCQALATAWGLREPGPTAPPTICLPGQNVMVFTEPPLAPSNTAQANHIQPMSPRQGKEEVESGQSAYEYRKNK
jgi:hypothetical protein